VEIERNDSMVKKVKAEDTKIDPLLDSVKMLNPVSLV